jgi:hypothetical protein
MMARTATILLLGIVGGEIPNPKHEIRNKSPLGGIKDPNVSNRKNFCILIFEFWICFVRRFAGFDIRISDFSLITDLWVLAKPG